MSEEQPKYRCTKCHHFFFWYEDVDTVACAGCGTLYSLDDLEDMWSEEQDE